MLGQGHWMRALLGVGVLGLASTAWADVILLKNGQEIKGKIVGKTDETIKVRIMKSGIRMTRSIRRTQIKTILTDDEAAAQKARAAASDEDRAPQAAEPADEEGAGKPDAPAGRKRPPIQIDLRMALTEALIRDSFEDGGERVEPRGRGYFVLVPFRYEAADGPYVITRNTIKFTADRGTARVRGLVPLEEKRGGTRRAAQTRGPAAGQDQPDEQGEPVALETVKNAPLYEKMTVYQDENELMVSYHDVVKPKSEREKASGRSIGRSSGVRRGVRGRSSRGRYGFGRTRGRATGRRPSYGRAGSYTQRGSRGEARGSEKRGYERRGYEKSPAGADDRDDAVEQRATYTQERPKGRQRRPKEGEPGNGWAAYWVELSNEAAVLTAHVGPKDKVVIELRLINALAQTGGSSRSRKSEDQQDLIEAVADYAAHESPTLSRLAVARLAELRGSGKSPAKGRGAKTEEGTVDSRTRLIEAALLEAVTSQDERTRHLAWRELTSTEALPKSTEELIVASERPEVTQALLELVETEIKTAAKLLGSSEASRRRPTARGPTLRKPSLRTGRKGPKAREAVSYTPVDLPESVAAQGTWSVLGALMRVGDAGTSTRAVSLALEDGSRQAVTLLGQPYPEVAIGAVKVMAKAPNTPAKHQGVRMVVSGVPGFEGGEAGDVLSALSEIAKGMSLAGDPLRVAGADELLMALVPANRDKPELQLKSLYLLQWCVLDQVMETTEMEQWLAGMIDKLVAPANQVATYQLIAAKWMPNHLVPLARPGKGKDATPAPGQRPAARPPARPTRTPGQARRPAKAPSVGKPTEPQGVIEKFLVEGLKNRREPEVRVPVIAALVRAGRPELVLEEFKSAGPEACAGLIKVVGGMLAQAPPSLVPGLASRFASLGLVMGLVREHEEDVVHAQAAATLSDLLKACTGKEAWRLGLAFKRWLRWDALTRLCLTPDPQAAAQARKAIGGILGLAEGERSAIESAVDRAELMGKLRDYDKQRGGKIAGAYHGLVLCELLVPNYTLQLEAQDDPDAKERAAKIANLTWSRRVIGLEPGTFEVVVGEDRKIEVKLGQAVVGTGKAPTGKAPATKPSGRQAARPGAGRMSFAEAMRRQAQLQRPGAPRPGASADEPPASSFTIQLPKLIDTMRTLPSMAGKVPPMNPPETLKARAPAKPKPDAQPTDPLGCPMHHLAFGTRQGSLRLGDGTPPTFDTLEVRVDANGRIIRGAQPTPVIQEVQIFLEPVSATQ